MSIIVIGINYKTASIVVREKAYFSLDKIPLYLQDVLNRGALQEAVLISTCNRSELYAEVENANNIPSIYDWFCMQTQLLCGEDISSAIYLYRDEKAIAHIMQVACGLDSMILGEPQILGQLKAAYTESCAAAAVGTVLHRLFQQVFAVAKEVRTTTAIGACPVSVASAAVHFAKQHISDLTKTNIVLIGAGDTSKLLAQYLKTHSVHSITIVNRHEEKACLLAAEIHAQVETFEQLPQALSKADLVFSATGSVTPIIDKTMMNNVVAQREKKSPLLLIDIAVPRDIDANVAELTNIKLYCIDDLKNTIEKNRQGREHAANKAREMIYKKSHSLMEELKSIDKITHTIRAYRRQMENICHHELIKAKQQLRLGNDPTDVLDAFAYAFMKKLLHAPSVGLRQAGVEGRLDVLKLAKQLFAIPDHEVERL